MRFLVDAQLPPALARWLAGKGHAAEHVADVGLAHASDKDIWDHALAVGAVIVSKDEDFAQRRILASAGPTVVWVRLPNTRRRSCSFGSTAFCRRFCGRWSAARLLIEIV